MAKKVNIFERMYDCDGNYYDELKFTIEVENAEMANQIVKSMNETVGSVNRAKVPTNMFFWEEENVNEIQDIIEFVNNPVLVHLQFGPNDLEDYYDVQCLWYKDNRSEFIERDDNEYPNDIVDFYFTLEMNDYMNFTKKEIIDKGIELAKEKLPDLKYIRGVTKL